MLILQLSWTISSIRNIAKSCHIRHYRAFCSLNIFIFFFLAAQNASDDYTSSSTMKVEGSFPAEVTLGQILTKIGIYAYACNWMGSPINSQDISGHSPDYQVDWSFFHSWFSYVASAEMLYLGKKKKCAKLFRSTVIS